MEFDEWLKVPERGNIPHVVLRIGADILLQDLPCHRFQKRANGRSVILNLEKIS